MSQKPPVPLDWRRLEPGDPFSLDLQFFGEDLPADPPADPAPPASPPADPPADPPKALTPEDVKRMLDSKITPLAAQNKKLSDALAKSEAELEKIRREKLTVEEQQALAAAEREKKLAEEAAKNQRDKLEIAALRKLTGEGYSQEWVDLLLAPAPSDLDGIDERAKKLKALMDAEVARQVAERLKAGGSPPKNVGGGQTEDLSALSDEEFFEKMRKKEK